MADWDTTLSDSLAAAEAVLSGAWGLVQTAATPQIGAMIQIAQQMETDYLATPPRLTEDEYQQAKSLQKNALEGILSGYEAIGIVAAEQAADAAWAVIETALKASIPFI